jgi:drug/metabolite transporter (DMT)-like permease
MEVAVPGSADRPARAGTKVSNRVWLALSTVYIVWGSTYLAIRVADQTIPPFLMAAARFLIAGSLLFALSVRRGDRQADPIGRRQWKAATVIGGLLLVGGNGGVVWAEQHVPSGVAALIIAGVPLWMALIATAAHEERLRGMIVAGLIVGFGGTALLVSGAGSKGPIHLSGLLALVLASLSWAVGSVLSRRVPLPKRPLVSTGMEMLAGGGVLLVAAAVSGEFARLKPSRISEASLIAVVYLILFGSLVAFSAYVWLLQNATTSLVSTYAYVNPVIAVTLGVLILHERFTPVTALSGLLIVTAVALIVGGQDRTDGLPAIGVSKAA